MSKLSFQEKKQLKLFISDIKYIDNHSRLYDMYNSLRLELINSEEYISDPTILE